MPTSDQSTQIIVARPTTPGVAVPPAATESTAPVKPGYQTTEFWLSGIATVLGVVMASGSLPEGGLAGQIIGGVLSVLAALGYTAARAKIKTGG